MSDNVRPEVAAFRELEALVRHVGDELAGFRRRALLAEARIKEFDQAGAVPSGQESRDLQARVTELEHENAALRGRLEAATARTRQVLDRVRFIRQQVQGGGDR
jgi:hypothetical protein